MKIGIAIDNWKLPIFKKILDEAGIEFTEHKEANNQRKNKLN